MAYHLAKRVTVTNEPEALPKGLRWANRKDGKSPYTVLSEAGGMDTRYDHCATLTDARKLARQLAKERGWAEVFRWAESGVQIRKVFVASYERELIA